MDIIQRVGAEALEGLKTNLNTVVDWWHKIQTVAGWVWDLIKWIGKEAMEGLRASLNSVKSILNGVNSAGEWLIDQVTELASMTLGGLAAAISGISGALSGAAGAAGRLVSSLRTAIGLQSNLDKASPGVVPKFSGGISSGGPTLVGESGPELVFLPKSTRVRTASRSRIQTAGGGGTSAEDIRAALDGMRFEMGDGFITMVTRGLRDHERAVA